MFKPKVVRDWGLGVGGRVPGMPDLQCQNQESPGKTRRTGPCQTPCLTIPPTGVKDLLWARPQVRSNERDLGVSAAKREHHLLKSF